MFAPRLPPTDTINKPRQWPANPNSLELHLGPMGAQPSQQPWFDSPADANPATRIQEVGSAAPPAGNPFDQFDAPTAAANPFDQFDTQAPQSAAQTPSTYQALDSGMFKGLTANFGDEIFGGVATPIEMGIGAYTGEDAGKGLGQRISDSYGRARDKERGAEQAATEAHPWADLSGQLIGGSMLGGHMPTLMNPVNPTVGNMALRGAAEGAAYGGAYGAGEGEGLADRFKRAMSGAAFGGAMGAPLGAVGGALATRNAVRAAPTNQMLEQQGRAAFQGAENLGVSVTPQSFDTAVNDITNMAHREGIDPTLHPGATAAVGRLQGARNAGTPQTAQDMTILRRVANSAVGSDRTNNDQMRIGSQVVDAIDNYLMGLTPNDTVGGVDPSQLGQLLGEGRDAWTRLKKSQGIDEAVELAENSAPNWSQSGTENALRTQFRRMHKPQNEGQYTPGEWQQMRRVVRGDVPTNIARSVGKAAPRSAFAGTMLGTAGILGGVPLAAGLAGAGEVGRAIAGALATNNVNTLSAMVRTGPGFHPNLTPLQQAIGPLLMNLAGQTGSKVPTP